MFFNKSSLSPRKMLVESIENRVHLFLLHPQYPLLNPILPYNTRKHMSHTSSGVGEHSKPRAFGSNARVTSSASILVTLPSFTFRDETLHGCRIHGHK